MKVAIVGAAGKAGSKIVEQALASGHEVTAIVRPGSSDRITKGCDVLEKDLFELTAADLNGFDAVIDAFGSRPGKEEEHVTSLRRLTELLKSYPETRLLVVGGAGSLFTDETRTDYVINTIPEQYRAVPEKMFEAFRELKKSGIKWTYFSPAAKFDPQGRRTGKYILGADELIPNSFGESYISYADYAIAMVDELEKGQFIGKRFTAVSDTSAIEREKAYNLFDISSGSGFTRRGSYFGIYTRPAGFARGGMTYASGALSIASRRGGIAMQKDNILFRIIPTYQGHNIPYTVRTTPTELRIVSLYGTIRCCFPDPNLLYIKGEGGLSLKLEKEMSQHQIMKRRGDRAWEESIIYLGDLIINPLKGDLQMHAPWDWEGLSTPRVRGVAVPDENGEFLLAFDESTYSGILREHYPAYEEGLENATVEWEGFLKNIPHFDRQLEEYREEAAWTLWSYLVDPAGLIKRPLIYMTGTNVASEWQMCQNAVALNGDMELATELLINMLDQASPTGQLPDFYDDLHGANMMYKPPLQGWALKWIMKNHDLGKEIPHEKLKVMYEGFLRWADWFFKYRDDDGDGIPQYEHGDETGFDDTSVFQKSPIMETPDLIAYLALLYEALGDLAKILGKDANVHYVRSKELIDKMIETFWNGERFVSFVNGTHELVATDSVLYYIPIILGKRLPQPIIEKLTADLSVENEFLTGYGFASERLSSDDFRTTGMARGLVLPPVNLLLLTGLYDAGKEDLAKKVALRYCTSLKDGGLNMIINPLQGNFGGFGCSWPACAYVVLADLYSNL